MFHFLGGTAGILGHDDHIGIGNIWVSLYFELCEAPEAGTHQHYAHSDHDPPVAKAEKKQVLDHFNSTCLHGW
ncbi:hypothetical protein D3C86_1938980 [compost metagenome]